MELLVPARQGRTADGTGPQVIAQRRVVHQHRLDITQTVSLANMPNQQRQELAPAGKDIAPARSHPASSPSARIQIVARIGGSNEVQQQGAP